MINFNPVQEGSSVTIQISKILIIFFYKNAAQNIRIFFRSEFGGPNRRTFNAFFTFSVHTFTSKTIYINQTRIGTFS